jgi:hydrogenase maturation protease
VLLKPLLILCLGNEILSDDRFGAEIEMRLSKREDLLARADVIFAPIAGFNLLDLLENRRKVLIVDTIQSGASPGTLFRFSADQFGATKNLTTSHQIALPTALELGRKFGVELPDVVDILAVEAGDVVTLGEVMTPPVQGALQPALQWIAEWIISNSSGGTREE